MDQLEIFKQQWQSQQTEYPKYSKERLSSLLASKSSSITKWLLIIAVIEFVIFTVVDIWSLRSPDIQKMLLYTGKTLYYVAVAIHLVAITFFIYLFWQNYRRISTVQPTRELMKNILRTRKTMKWYIWFNLIYVLVFTMVLAVLMLQNSPELEGIRASQEYMEHPYQVGAIVLGVFFGVTLIMCALMYLFYYLIYGILLGKLHRNYKELKKIEV
ncbi:MAG: hypothetical protein WBA16_04015 [Nonlabens sp.]